MNDSSENENQSYCSKTTRNSRKIKNVLSVRWTPLLDNAFHNPNEILPFSGITGPVRNTPQGQETLLYFNLFFTDKIIEDIVLESNRYRNQAQLQQPSKRTCKPIVKEEISAFIGLTIAMGIAKFPEIRDYWKSKGSFHMPWFASIMTRDRFEEIYRYLHLADNDKQAPRDLPNFNKLYKLGILPCELS